MGVCDGLVHGAAQLRRGRKDVVLADEREHAGPGQLIAESGFDADQHQPAVASMQGRSQRRSTDMNGLPAKVWPLSPMATTAPETWSGLGSFCSRYLGAGEEQAAVHLKDRQLVARKDFRGRPLLRQAATHHDLRYRDLVRLVKDMKQYDRLSYQKYLSADMVCYEGKGVPVDIELLNTKANTKDGIDPLVTCALEEMKSKRPTPRIKTTKWI
jgi:hypothetical protein